MKGIIDTSSLVAISRYYLSIKDEVKLLSFIYSKFSSRELLLLSSIHEEAKYTQKGIALSKMDFLNDTDFIVADEDMLPPSPKRFSNQVDNNFCISILRKRLNEEQYLQQKARYMLTGDARMIIYALNHKTDDPVIITEETHTSNDGKLFRKLPAICDMLKIKHMTIAEWLSSKGVTLTWTHPEI